MFFTLAASHPNGKLGSPRRFSHEEIRAGHTGRKLIGKFEQIFRERLRPAKRGGHQLRFPLAKTRDVWLDWFQPWSFSATATIEVAGAPGWTLTFLTGYYPDLEEATIRILDALLTMMKGKPTASELRSFGDRPVVALVPWVPQPRGVDLNEVMGWVTCLAVVYFERAAERKAAMPPDPERTEEPPAKGG